MCSSMDHRDASENAEIVIVRISRANKPFFFETNRANAPLQHSKELAGPR